MNKKESGKKSCYQNMEGNHIEDKSVLNFNRGGRETYLNYVEKEKKYGGFMKQYDEKLVLGIKLHYGRMLGFAKNNFITLYPR